MIDIKLLIILSTIAVALFSAARELVNLRADSGSWFYTWKTGIPIVDAFHVYPFISLLGAAVIPFYLYEYFEFIFAVMSYFYVFYQFRNVFMHVLLPNNGRISHITNWQSINAAVAVFACILFYNLM